MNVVTLIGNLANEVEVKELGDGKRVGKFLLAIDRPGQDKGADFVWIAVWDKQADVCGRYLGKGKRVAIDGRLRSRSWEEPDGKRRSAVEVVANSVQFLSPREEDADAPFEAAAAR